MRNKRYVTFVLAAFVGCSYINGAGDADKFADEYAATQLRGAKNYTHTCQTRDTDGNGYVTCSISVDWGASGGHQIIPLECSVNRAGNGCGNEGCRPLATYSRGGGFR